MVGVRGRAHETGAYMEFLVMASLVVIGDSGCDIAIFTSLVVTSDYGNTGVPSVHDRRAGLLRAAGGDHRPHGDALMAGKRRTVEERADIADKVIERIASETDGLRAICADYGVSASRFMDWVDKSPELAERYARAKRLQAELLAAEIVAIADEVEVEAKYQGEDIKLDLSANTIARNRLRVDARKWVASKLLPKVYGDKLAIGGAEDLPPVQTNVVLEPSEAYKRMLGGGA